MSSPFDAAWADADDHLGVEMGERISIGGKVIENAVVDAAMGAAKFSGMSISSGVQFTVFLNLEQVQEMCGEKGSQSLQSKEVTRGNFKGRVLSVLDMGGAGASLDVGPLGGR